MRFFLGRAARNLAKPHLVLTPEVEKVLLAHGWPGNVRELENTMEQVAILCDDVIKPDGLPVTSSGPARPVLFRDNATRSHPLPRGKRGLAQPTASKRYLRHRHFEPSVGARC